MPRRRFDHLFEELSVALGRLAPRYALWLRMSELGLEPERLSRADVLGFCERDLDAFLTEQALWLSPRDRRRLQRSVARFDPRQPTPYDHMSRIGAAIR